MTIGLYGYEPLRLQRSKAISLYDYRDLYAFMALRLYSYKAVYSIATYS